VRFSGIVWDSETLVTAAERLHGADTVTVHTGHESVNAEILASDLTVDIAVLRARTGAPGISAARPSGLQAGDDVVVAGRGHSGGIVTWSQVEQVGPAWRSRSGGELDRWIRLAPGLRPTLEGGGAFDLEGRLCAMVVTGPRHQTLGIPFETMERLVSTVLQHGRLPQPYLGVRLQSVALDETLQQQLSRKKPEAAVVVGVETDSPAAMAGIVFGDIVLSVAQQPIESAIDLKVALNRAAVGTTIALQVFRAGNHIEKSVVVRERNGSQGS
jgi:serine protease Do